MFLGGSNAERHAILFDKSFCNVATASPGSGQAEIVNNIYTPLNELEAGSTYYWRVDTVRKNGTTKEGQVWCFDVEAPGPNNPELATSWNLRSLKSDCTRMNVEEHCAQCKDDMSFRFQGNPDKSCNWVAMKPDKRCDKSDVNDEKTVKEACPVTCDACDDDDYSTSSPTGAPTGGTAPQCHDDMSFRFQGNPDRSCNWVAMKPAKRCGKSDINDEKTVKEACPVTCDACDDDDSSTPSPTAAPTSPPCEDDTSFHFQGNPDKSCNWVAMKPAKRCDKSDVNDEKTVKEACPVSCGLCDLIV